MPSGTDGAGRRLFSRTLTPPICRSGSPWSHCRLGACCTSSTAHAGNARPCAFPLRPSAWVCRLARVALLAIADGVCDLFRRDMTCHGRCGDNAVEDVDQQARLEAGATPVASLPSAILPCLVLADRVSSCRRRKQPQTFALNVFAAGFALSWLRIDNGDGVVDLLLPTLAPFGQPHFFYVKVRGQVF